MPRKIDAVTTIEEIHQDRKIIRQRQYKKRSKLDKHRSSLVELRRGGASYPDLVYWLRKAHRINIHHTSVMRYLNQLPEMIDRDLNHQ